MQLASDDGNFSTAVDAAYGTLITHPDSDCSTSVSSSGAAKDIGLAFIFSAGPREPNTDGIHLLIFQKTLTVASRLARTHASIDLSDHWNSESDCLTSSR